MIIISNSNHLNYKSCLEGIIDRVDVLEQPLTNRELLAVCGKAADFLRSEGNLHSVHEIVETALNFLILKKYAKELLSAQNPAEV